MPGTVCQGLHPERRAAGTVSGSLWLGCHLSRGLSGWGKFRPPEPQLLAGQVLSLGPPAWGSALPPPLEHLEVFLTQQV